MKKNTEDRFDVIVIGAGVVGCSIARELSRFKVKVAVLEKESDVGWGSSCRNSGVIHAGFNNKPGTLMAKYCVEGNQKFHSIAQELDVPFKKTGKLVVAKKNNEITGLKKLKRQGELNGVKNLEIIGEQEIKKLEPNVRGVAALLSPETAITSPYLYTIALAENALKNGVRFYLNTEVENIKKKTSGEFFLKTQNKQFIADYLINSTGVYCDEIARMAGIDCYRIYPCRGEYYVLDKNASSLMNHLIYPVPHIEEGGLGIHLTPTVDGNVLIGPSNEYIDINKRNDYAVTMEVLFKLCKEAQEFLPAISPRYFIRNYAGIRSKQTPPSQGGYKDYVIEESEEAPNMISLIGIESPGLTAAYPIAKKVVSMIDQKEKLTPNPHFNPYRKGILRFEEQDDETKKELVEENSDYGEVICRCEQVTKKEILEAIDNPLGARSLISIKYRSRAMMGRCQGGYCQTRILELLKEKYNYNWNDFLLRGSGSYMLTGNRSNGEPGI
ncbi:MAG: FAD dependent oxidoreductase [candidate division TA06 bacterium 32_111]|jgi:glycerol-3-phosphate dehydrogenase|nr:MAG: FAD dependent oxidoreductase [candidate division TA06 bacterium 32_111]